MENTSFVGRDLYIADQGRIAPNAERIVREAAGAYELTIVITELEAGHLRTSVDAVDSGTSGGIPEMDVPVVRTTTGREEVELPRAPAESFDSRTMVGLREFGSVEGPCIPDRDKFVVPTRGQLCSI